MRRARRMVIAAVAVALALASCGEPTQILVTVRTNLPFAPGDAVGIVADTPDGIEGGVFQSLVREAWSEDGVVGTLTVVPPSASDRSSRVGLRVVLARGRDPSQCSIADSASCVIARRSISYLAGTTLRVNVFLWQSCEGVGCTKTTTCNKQGVCVSRELETSACVDASGCSVDGDPVGAFGGVEPIGDRDAASDGRSVDGAHDAPDASFAQDAAMIADASDAAPGDAAQRDGGLDGGSGGCAGQPGSPWPMVGRCRDRSALSLTTATTTAMTTRWSKPVSSGATTPVIAADGTLYICNAGALRALDPATGNERWNYPVGTCSGAPAIGADGTVYVATSTTLLAITPAGTNRWTGPSGAGPVIVGPDGSVFVRSFGYLTVVNPATGATIRNLNIGTTPPSLPAIAADGTVYVGGLIMGSTNALYSFSASGAVNWTHALNSGTPTPTLGADGTIYIAIGASQLAALNPSDGSQKWATNVTMNPDSIALGSDGALYFCGSLAASRYVGSVSAAGTVRWSTGYGIEGCYLSVDQNSNVFVTGRLTGGGPDIRALSGTNGMQVWARSTIGTGSDAPTIGADGTLYAVLNNAGSFALVALAPAP